MTWRVKARTVRRALVALAIAVVPTIAVAVVVGGGGGGLRDLFVAVCDRAAHAGTTGALLYAVTYFGAILTLLPSWILTAGAGFAFGMVKGFVIAMPIGVGGACTAFALGRTLLRGWAERRVLADPRFVALDDAVEANGFRLVALMRLALVFPFNLLNYGFGATRIRFRDFFLGSLLGGLPGTLLYVYLGSVATSAADLGKAGSGPRLAASLVGLVLGGAVLYAIVKRARRELRRGVTPGTAPRSTPGAPPESRRAGRRRPRSSARPAAPAARRERAPRAPARPS